jgi:site-specific DNA-cytosine methylase
VDELVVELAERLAKDDVPLPEAAQRIGVTVNTLTKHLNGEYVRSDSAAKYRRFLRGEARAAEPLTAPRAPQSTTESAPALAVPDVAPTRERPLRVVDLFSGCGGLSLGFDLRDEGRSFDTVLAMDIEPAMVNVLNSNRLAMGRTACGVITNLADVRSEAEALALYLYQVGGQSASALGVLPNGDFAAFLNQVWLLDQRFLSDVALLRASPAARSVRALSSEALKQTSVLSFHSSLGLPNPGSRDFAPALLWFGADQPEPADGLRPPANVVRTERKRLSELWDAEVDALREKALGTGRGQLQASSRRISAFLGSVEGEFYTALRERWLAWASERDALRRWYFEPALPALRERYADHGVDVLVGGPPCQGFSRIGRGKIRSLRESGVQAHVDAEAGDERNKLLYAYVLMVSALRPRVFVFENVRHFQAEVRTPQGVFRADELLAEAIEDLSSGHLRYGVSSRIVHAVRHGVPQTRERYFMAGVRADICQDTDARTAAQWILSLPEREEVPLGMALAGLPAPDWSGAEEVSRAVTTSVATDGSSAADRYMAWIRQPLAGRESTLVDGHVARRPRSDDQAWFSRMGPGTRWLDYRVDTTPSLAALTHVLGMLQGAVQEDAGIAEKLGLEPEAIDTAAAMVDGSLALRLLLETIPPQDGELGHHLLADGYLAKKMGNHGDWLARLSATKPCKTITSHMGKDTYAYVHPFENRTLSLREAARVQTFPDWFSLGMVSLVDGYRVIGNAVPPLLSAQIAERINRLLP